MTIKIKKQQPFSSNLRGAKHVKQTIDHNKPKGLRTHIIDWCPLVHSVVQMEPRQECDTCRVLIIVIHCLLHSTPLHQIS